MNINGSSKITVLDFSVRWDLSLVNPKVKLTNASVGSDLPGCKFWFVLYGPDGTAFHTGSLGSPDSIGNWTEIDITETITQIMGHLPWGEGFRVQGFVNDGTNTYGPEDKSVEICRPNGNEINQENNFGAADVYVELKCLDKKIFVEDQSDYTYKGEEGTLVSRTTKVVWAPDASGATPTPFTDTNPNESLLIPFTEDGDCHILLVETIRDYVFGDHTIRIKYKFRKQLDIRCNISLCDIVCGISKLEKKVQTGSCSAADLQTLTLINSKFNRIIAGIMQPTCGVNVPALIDEVKALLGNDCSCS